LYLIPQILQNITGDQNTFIFEIRRKYISAEKLMLKQLSYIQLYVSDTLVVPSLDTQCMYY